MIANTSDLTQIAVDVRQTLQECLLLSAACAGSVLLLVDNQEPLRIVVSTDDAKAVMDIPDRLLLATDDFLIEAIQTGKLVFLKPHRAVAIPLLHDGEVIGALGLTFEVSDFPTARDTARLTALARQCCVTIDQSLLQEELQRVRQDSKRFAALTEQSSEVIRPEDPTDSLHVSEQRYHCLVEATSQIVCVRDSEGKIAASQPSWKAFTDQSDEEMLGFGFLLAIHPEDRERTRQEWEMAVCTGSVHEFEYRLRRHDGEYCLMAVRAVPVLDTDGTIQEWISVHTDITTVKAANAHFAAVVDSVSEAIISVDKRQRVVQFNRAAERMFGYAAADIIGTPLNRCLPERFRDAHRGHLQTFAASGISELHASEIGILWALRADGTEFPIEASVARVSVDDSYLYTAVLRDVSEQMMIERARREAVESLRTSEQRYRSLTEATSQIVWIAKSDGGMDLPQPGWASFTGQTDEEITRPSSFMAVHPDEREESLRAWKEAVAVGQIFEIEHRLRRHDGEYRMMVMRAVPIRSDDGSVLEWIGIHTDITEQRMMERRQRQFIKDVLISVTEGRLRLCDTVNDLPQPLSALDATGESQAFLLSPETLAEIRRRVRTLAGQYGFSEERAMGLMGAASECAMNAVTHGTGAHARVLSTADGSVLQVWVTDEGHGIDMEELPKAALMKGYSGIGGAGGFGHGFFLMLAYVDTIHLLTGPEGTTVVLEQNRTAPSEMPGF